MLASHRSLTNAQPIRWNKLHDPRVEINVFEDRIMRRLIELRAGRQYIAALQARRAAAFAVSVGRAANDAIRLAP
jgi:hypothetical protein